MKKFKLPQNISILTCEVYAIYSFLKYILENNALSRETFIICTDSMTAIQGIQLQHSKNVFIQRCLTILKQLR